MIHTMVHAIMHVLHVQVNEMREFAVAEHIKRVSVLENKHATEMEELRAQIENVKQGKRATEDGGKDDAMLRNMFVQSQAQMWYVPCCLMNKFVIGEVNSSIHTLVHTVLKYKSGVKSHYCTCQKHLRFTAYSDAL